MGQTDRQTEERQKLCFPRCGQRNKPHAIDKFTIQIHSTLCVKNDTALACYNVHVHQPILIIFGSDVAKKVLK